MSYFHLKCVSFNMYSCRVCVYMFQNEMECKHQWIYKKDQKYRTLYSYVLCIMMTTWKKRKKKKMEIGNMPEIFQFLFHNARFIRFSIYIFFSFNFFWVQQFIHILCIAYSHLFIEICQIFTIKPIRCGKWIEALECRILNF